MNITHCTLTGVDDSTSLDAISDISSAFPIIEWGILYSPKRQGQPGRYPSIANIQDALRRLPAHVRVAIHFCGQGVPDLLQGDPLLLGFVEHLAARGGRIQLNFNQGREPIDLKAVAQFIIEHPSITVITQHNHANQNVWSELPKVPNHAVLFDASGGRGIVPEAWPAPLPIACGYAGGLGRPTLKDIPAQLSKIAAVAGGKDVWIDMEGSLRSTGDWFDLLACWEVLEQVEEFQRNATAVAA